MRIRLLRNWQFLAVLIFRSGILQLDIWRLFSRVMESMEMENLSLENFGAKIRELSQDGEREREKK